MNLQSPPVARRRCRCIFLLVPWVVAVATTFAGGDVFADAPEGTTLIRQTDLRHDIRPGAGRIDTDGDTLTITSDAADPEPWALQLRSQELPQAVAKGRVLCLSFEARCVDAADGKDAEINVTVARNDPFETIQKEGGFRNVTVPRRWHPLTFCFRAQKPYPAETVYTSVQLAVARQTIQIRNLKLVDYGNIDEAQFPVSKLYYPDRDDDSWRADAQSRITQHRQAPLTITVTDQNGRPLPGRSVAVRQQRHAYAFGTFTGDIPLRDDADGRRFKQQTREWFNRVTLPRYWADWGTDKPAGVERSDAVAKWAQGEGFELKTHLLLYPQFIPQRVKDLSGDPVAFRREIETAMKSALDRTRDLPCVSWDAINELRDVTLVGDVLGTDYYAEVFRRGNTAQPNVKWFINEYGLLTGGSRRQGFMETYLGHIRSILADGGPIEGIGLQGHFQESLISMKDALGVIDQVAQFGLPVEITEFDVQTRDEETQAAFTRDLLTVVFSHPATTGFTIWGYWQGDMWRPEGAMFRTDWTMKPNGKVWQSLVLDEWWTDETVITDDAGQASLRVFKGTHRVEVGDRSETIDVTQDTHITLTR